MHLRANQILNEAASLGPDATPLDVFCKRYAIPPELAQESISFISKFRRYRNIRYEDPETCPFDEAINQVASAFERFHPEMGDIVREAYKQGRIIFYDQEAFGGREAATGSNKHRDTPSPILALDKKIRKLPYCTIGISKDQKGLSLADCYKLAHECGHLVADEVHYRAALSKKEPYRPLDNMPLHESFSFMGELLFHDYLMKMNSNDLDNQHFVTSIWKQNISYRTFRMAQYAAVHEAALNFYQEERQRSGKRFVRPEIDKLQAIIDSHCKEMQLWTHNVFLLQPVLYDIAYPLGVAAASSVFSQWNAHGADKKHIAEQWMEIAGKGKDIGFMDAMQAMHVGTHPYKDFLYNSIIQCDLAESNYQDVFVKLAFIKFKQNSYKELKRQLPVFNTRTDALGYQSPVVTLGNVIQQARGTAPDLSKKSHEK